MLKNGSSVSKAELANKTDSDDLNSTQSTIILWRGSNGSNLRNSRHCRFSCHFSHGVHPAHLEESTQLDKAAIITGIGKAKVVTGGGTIVIPVLQRIDYITLENINFEVAMRGSLTSDAVPIEVNGVVVVKVRNEEP